MAKQMLKTAGQLRPPGARGQAEDPRVCEHFLFNYHFLIAFPTILMVTRDPADAVTLLWIQPFT